MSLVYTIIETLNRKILGKTSVCTSRTANRIRRVIVRLASCGFSLYHTSRFFLVNKTLETTYVFVRTTPPPRTQKQNARCCGHVVQEQLGSVKKREQRKSAGIICFPKKSAGARRGRVITPAGR